MITITDSIIIDIISITSITITITITTISPECTQMFPQFV
jgi:hypothetical protein